MVNSPNKSPANNTKTKSNTNNNIPTTPNNNTNLPSQPQSTMSAHYEGEISIETGVINGVGKLTISKALTSSTSSPKNPSLIFTGSFSRGKKNGQGILQTFDGTGNCNTFEGTFEDDIISGVGIATFSNGNIYNGEFQKGKIEGVGVLTTKDGKYDGEWHNERMHGKGTYYYVDGDSYSGDWRNDKRHGGKLINCLVFHLINGKDNKRGILYCYYSPFF